MIRTMRGAAEEAGRAFLWAVVAAALYEKLGKRMGERLTKKKDSMAKDRKSKRVARLRGHAAAVESVRATSAGVAIAYLVPRWIGVLLLYLVGLSAFLISALVLVSRQPGAWAWAAVAGGMAVLMFVKALRRTARLSAFCRAVYSPYWYGRLIEEPLRKLGALPEAASAETARSEPGSDTTEVASPPVRLPRFVPRPEGAGDRLEPLPSMENWRNSSARLEDAWGQDVGSQRVRQSG